MGRGKRCGVIYGKKKEKSTRLHVLPSLFTKREMKRKTKWDDGQKGPGHHMRVEMEKKDDDW